MAKNRDITLKNQNATSESWTRKPANVFISRHLLKLKRRPVLQEVQPVMKTMGRNYLKSVRFGEGYPGIIDGG